MRKNFLFLFVGLFSILSFTSCSKEDSEDESNNPPSIPEELSEYQVTPCDGFITFAPEGGGNVSHLLNFLRSKGYDTNNDGNISCSEAESVIHLDFGNELEIKSLNGIEYLNNLKTITGTVNLVTSLDKSITTLNLFNNLNLEEINFNVVSTGQDSRIGTIVFPNSDKLKIVDFSETFITDEILNIANKPNLKFIKFRSSTPDILDLSSSELIEEIYVGNKLVLGEHNYLTTLETNSAEGIDFSLIPNIEALRTRGGHVTSVDLSNNKNLKILKMPSSNLAQIDLSNNTMLQELNLDNNLLSQLDLSSNSELKYLTVNANSLTSIDISMSKKIIELHTANNDLESIDLSNNLKLEIVDLSKNKFESLDFSAHSYLKYIDVSKNQLSYLSLKNGNNSALAGGTVSSPWGDIKYVNVKANDNNLDCIEIDEGFTNYDNWEIDNSTELSSNCD